MPVMGGGIVADPRRQRHGVLSSGSTAFSPLSLSPSLWAPFRALGLANNDPIGTGTDTSGNGNDFTAAGGARPTFKTNIQNGLSAALFDGAANFMDSVAFDRSQPETVFIVGKQTALATQSMFDAPDTVNRGRLFFYDAGAPFEPCTMYSGAGLTNAAATAAAWHIFTLQYNGASSKFRVDGGNEQTGDAGANASVAGMRIGLGGGASTDYFAGYIGEVLSFPAALSAGNIVLVETYLNTLWAIY